MFCGTVVEASSVQPVKEIVSGLPVIRYLEDCSRQGEIEGSRRIYRETLGSTREALEQVEVSNS